MRNYDNKENAVQAGRSSSRKGVPNKVTTEIRERFKDLLDTNFDKLQKDIDELEPKDRVKTMLELAKFVLPTLKAVDLTTGGVQLDRTVIVEFVDHSGHKNSEQ